MSTLNIKLRRRKKVIKVKKVLQRWLEYTAGFPGLEILDTEGKRHALACLDFSCTREEWNQIQEGSKVEITIQDSVIGVRLLPVKSSKKAQEEVISTSDYTWFCEVCGKRGEINYDGVDDPRIIANNIYKDHTRASPKCSPANVQIIDRNMVKQEELSRLVALERVK